MLVAAGMRTADVTELNTALQTIWNNLPDKIICFQELIKALQQSLGRHMAIIFH